MNLWSLIGLPVSFVILASLLLWLIVDSKIYKILKALMIAGVIWFGLVLLYTPSRIMGWPVNRNYDGMPDVGVVLSWKVIEPSVNTSEAGIYLWIVPKRYGKPEKNLYEIILLDPRYAFAYTLKDTPRAYKLPYNKPEHQKLSKSSSEAAKNKGLLLFRKRKGSNKRWDGQDFKDGTNWIVINPKDIFKK